MLRKLTLVALALSLLSAQAANAQPGGGQHGSHGKPPGKLGFSDGR